ncbi:MAG: hypothetical protein ABW321_23270, partial [Polyangiales bacterium]
MTKAVFFRLAAAAVLFAAVSGEAQAEAQDRPSEDDMFGGGSGSAPEQPAAPEAPATPSDQTSAEAPTPAAAAAAQTGPAAAGSQSPAAEIDARDAVLSGGDHPMFQEEAAPADPLTIGGRVYLRLQTTANENTPVKNYGMSSPTLLDMFLDARPNDRVRGFALGRMTYDPLLPSSPTSLSSAALMGGGGTAGSSSIAPIFTGATSSPRVLLDQLWLRFDIAHTLFITAGRQHVRWGTARFWMPADYLHNLRRNPLDIFDVRTGTTMIKVHLPIESRAWNFYAYGVTENAGGRPTLATPAGALRAELVLDAFEL